MHPVHAVGNALPGAIEIISILINVDSIDDPNKLITVIENITLQSNTKYVCKAFG